MIKKNLTFILSFAGLLYILFMISYHISPKIIEYFSISSKTLFTYSFFVDCLFYGAIGFVFQKEFKEHKPMVNAAKGVLSVVTFWIFYILSFYLLSNGFIVIINMYIFLIMISSFCFSFLIGLIGSSLGEEAR